MNPQQALLLNVRKLWLESPCWRNLVLMAMVCTVMAVMFHPTGSGGPGNSYTPSSQTSQPSASGPVVPPKAGAATLPPPVSDTPLNVVAPASPKIKPGRSAGNIETENRPQLGDDFAVYTDDRGANFIAPSRKGEVNVAVEDKKTDDECFGCAQPASPNPIQPSAKLPRD